MWSLSVNILFGAISVLVLCSCQVNGQYYGQGMGYYPYGYQGAGYGGYRYPPQPPPLIPYGHGEVARYPAYPWNYPPPPPPPQAPKAVRKTTSTKVIIPKVIKNFHEGDVIDYEYIYDALPNDGNEAPKTTKATTRRPYYTRTMKKKATTTKASTRSTSTTKPPSTLREEPKVDKPSFEPLVWDVEHPNSKPDNPFNDILQPISSSTSSQMLGGADNGGEKVKATIDEDLLRDIWGDLNGEEAKDLETRFFIDAPDRCADGAKLIGKKCKTEFP